MTVTEFCEKMKKAISCKVELKPDTVLENLEDWDSLSKMETVAFLDEEYGVKILFDDLSQLKTVGDIAKKAGF